MYNININNNTWVANNDIMNKYDINNMDNIIYNSVNNNNNNNNILWIGGNIINKYANF